MIAKSFWALTAGALIAANVLAVTPLVPKGEEQVIEVLPVITRHRLAGTAVATAPADPARAMAAARQHIQMARQTGDTRYWGRAQSVLAPWWNNAGAPVDIAVTQATIQQGRHEFGAQQRTILRNHPELKWCFTHMVEVHGGQLQEQVLPPDIAAQLTARPVMPYFVAAERDLSTGTCGAVLRLDVVRAAGGFNPTRRIAEDRDLWWRIAMSHPDIGYGPDVAWRYHTDTPSSLMKESADRSDSLRVVCEHLRWWRREQRVEFERYGRRLALNYLARAAARQIHVERAVLADAESLLGLSAGRRALLAAIRCLPRPLARPLIARWPDR